MKTKAKIVLFIFLSAIGLTVGFFFSGYVDLMLTSGTPEISRLHPSLLMVGIMENERHRMLTLCIEIVILTGIAAFILMSGRETFESDTSNITKNIKTPIAIGQGQHGTAKWMTRKEKRIVFSVYRLDSREPLYNALLLDGERDREELNYIGEDEYQNIDDGTEGKDNDTAAEEAVEED